MGWNDRFDPSEYDPACVDSMRALADRAVREAPAAGEDTGTCYQCKGTENLIPGYRIRDFDRIVRGGCETCLPGECWDCGARCEGHECNRCWRMSNY